MKFAIFSFVALIAFAGAHAQAAECSISQETKAMIAAATAAKIANVTATTNLTHVTRTSLRKTARLISTHISDASSRRVLEQGRIVRLIRKAAPIQCSQSEDTPICLAATIVKAKTAAGLCR